MNRMVIGGIVCVAIILSCWIFLSAAPSDDSRKMVSIIYGGEKGDFGYIDQAYLGYIRARDDLHFVTREEIWTRLDTYDPVSDPLTGFQADMVILIGDSVADYAVQVSNEHPDLPVVIIDASPTGGNYMRSVTFSMYGASYLAGILAANQTKTKKVGVIAGKDAPVISTFTDGFIDGVAAENPGVQVTTMYLADNNSGFFMPEEAERIAEEMNQNGTDIIFTVAGGSGLGVISAANRLSDLKVIGVDSDQSHLGPGVVIASVIKNLDGVVYREIESVLSGSFQPGSEVTGIETDGSALVFNPRFDSLSAVVETRRDEAAKKEDDYSDIV